MLPRSRNDSQVIDILQLFYKTGRLRVVISTANLIDYDWRDMENVKSRLRSIA